MAHRQAIPARERLLQRLSATSEIQCGSLVERITHHSRLPQLRQWLSNYQELKGTIEAICELNPILPRPDVSVGKARSAPRDCGPPRPAHLR